jgi:hypothetical protein
MSGTFFSPAPEGGAAQARTKHPSVRAVPREDGVCPGSHHLSSFGRAGTDRMIILAPP